MKKRFCTIITMALMALLLLSVGAITCANAQAAERISWSMVVQPTYDGVWTPEDEWTDGGDVTTIGEDVSFTSTWYFGDAVVTQWLVEFLSDTTDDAEDYWEFCIDGFAEGGSAPQAGDYKFVITGHTDLVWYEGDGSGWTEVSLDETEIEWANALSASPTDSTEHWVLEFEIPKNAETVQMDVLWYCRIAVYDASTETLAAWPEDSNADEPSTWGLENYTSETIPEGFSFGVMVLLSSVAVVVAAVGLRKRLRD